MDSTFIIIRGDICGGLTAAVVVLALAMDASFGAGPLALSVDESRNLEDTRGRILLYYISGPMSFAAAKSMARQLAGFDEYNVLVLDLSDVP